MRFLKINIFLIFLILLACTTKYSEDESEFYKNLGNNYRSYAEYKRSNYDWKAARIFDNKADAIEKGGVINPENSFMGIKSIEFYSKNVRYAEIKDYYERMYIVFNVDGVKTKYPKELADMQFHFDCWIVEESIYERYSQISRCKENFINNLSFLEKDLVVIDKEQKKYFDDSLDNKVVYKNNFIPRKTYVVYFDFDSSVLTEDGAVALEKFLYDYSFLANKEKYTVNLSGHADRVGSKKYNEKLSKRRMDTIKHYLVKNGVNGDFINAKYMGEIDPRVITSDNAKEDTNRRVVIMVNPKR